MVSINSSKENSGLYNSSLVTTKKTEVLSDIIDNKNNNFQIKEKLSVTPLNESELKSKNVCFFNPLENNEPIKLNLIEKEKFSVQTISFKNADAEKVNEKIKNISEVVAKIDGLEELSPLLAKVKPGYQLTDNDYKLLDKLSNVINNKLADSSIEMSPSERSALEQFSKSFGELSNYKKEMEAAYTSYASAKTETDKDVTTLKSALNQSLGRLKEKGIEPEVLTEMMQKSRDAGLEIQDLNSIQNGSASPERVKEITDKFLKAGVSQATVDKFLSNYKEVMMAGLIIKTLENYEKESAKAGNNPTTGFAIYQSYIQKFTAAVASNDSTKLAQIMENYNDLGKEISQVNNSNLSNEEKISKLNNIITNYTKDDPAQAETIMALIHKDLSDDLDVSNALNILGDAVGSLSNKSKKIDFINGATNKDVNIAKSATPDSYNFIKADPSLKKMLNKLDTSFTNLSTSTNKLVITSRKFSARISDFSNKIKNIMDTNTKADTEKFKVNNLINSITEIKNPIDTESIVVKKDIEPHLEEKNDSDKSLKSEVKLNAPNKANEKIEKKLESQMIDSSFIRNKVEAIRQSEKYTADKENREFTIKLDTERQQKNSIK